VEPGIRFGNVVFFEHNVSKKIKKYHATAGESGFHLNKLVKRAV